jgi:hypothetical protein
MGRALLAGLALALALLLAGGAMANPRPAQVGDIYRYSSETEDVVTGVAQPYRQTSRVVYDLEVLDLRADGVVLRYTVREAQVEDDRGGEAAALARAYLNLPVVFETDQALNPVRLLDWPGFKGAYLARLDPAQRQAAGPILADLEKDPQALVERYSGDMRTFAPYLKLDGGDLECRFPTSRSEGGSRNGVRYRSKVKVVVSGADGWVLEADESRTDRKPDGVTESRTVKVRRLSPLPSC